MNTESVAKEEFFENVNKENPAIIEKANELIKEMKTKYKLRKVESTNIKAIGYDNEKKDLFVLFTNGGFYKYNPVEEDIYNSFLKATSIGKFFFAQIRSNKDYKYEKIEFKFEELEIMVSKNG